MQETPSVTKIEFDKKDKELLLNKKVVVYGAGRIAKKVIVALNDIGVEDIRVVVTDSSHSPEKIFGYDVVTFGTLEHSPDAVFVPAVGVKLMDEVVKSIKDGGYGLICHYKRK